MQSDLVLISSRLLPSQKECETNPGSEQKNAAAFAIPALAEEQSLHSHLGEREKSASRTNKIVTLISIKTILYAQGRPEADATDAGALGPAPLGSPRHVVGVDYSFCQIHPARENSLETPYTFHC